MLKGLRVVEMATYIAAPAAGGILADWGADVIKVEGPNGDPIRYFFAGTNAEDIGNPVFDVDNRGKRDVALDIKTPEGAAALRKLVGSADVFLTNIRPAALERAGLDYETLHAAHPKLIYASVSGYGLEGPDRDKPGFDMAAFWARSGQALLTTRKGDDPLPMRIAVGDHTTSLAVVSGVLAALHHRNNTGEGQLVECSLLGTGIYTLASDLSIQQRIGRVASTKTRAEAADPLTNPYQCGDGKWVIVLPRQGVEEWPRYVAALGLDESYLTDEKFANRRARIKNRADVVALLDATFAKFDIEEAKRRLDEHDVIYAPMQSPADVMDDPQAAAAGAFTEVPGPNGPVPSIATPVRFHNDSGIKSQPRGASPEVGEHTEEVLREVGLSDADIAAVIKRK